MKCMPLVRFVAGLALALSFSSTAAHAAPRVVAHCTTAGIGMRTSIKVTADGPTLVGRISEEGGFNGGESVKATFKNLEYVAAKKSSAGVPAEPHRFVDSKTKGQEFSLVSRVAGKKLRTSVPAELLANASRGARYSGAYSCFIFEAP